MAITVTARPFERSFSGNTVFYTLYSEAAAASAANYFEVQLLFQYVDAGDYQVIATLPYNPFQGAATVEISAILNSLLQYGLPPLGDDTAHYNAPQQTGYFYIHFREITPTDQTPAWDTTEQEFRRFVIKGGLDVFRHRGNAFWTNYWPVKKPFLTWQRSGRLASLTERLYLAFLNSEDLTNQVLRITVVYTDGTGSAADHAMGGAPDVVKYIPAGGAQWGLAVLDEQKTIWYWQLQLFDMQLGGSVGVATSEAFRFYADNRGEEPVHILHFRSSMGGLNSLPVRGPVEKKLTYSPAEQQRAVPADYYLSAAIMPQRITTGNKEKQGFKGDVGHVSKEDLDRLRDAQLQREVWMERFGKWWPVVITTPDFTLSRSDDMRFHMPIEWELAHNGTPYYTPDSIDFGTGVLESNVCNAFVSGVNVVVEDDPSFAPLKKATISFTENDPDNASGFVRFRYYNDEATYPWTQHDYSAIVIPVQDENLTTMEIQAICSNNVLGRKITAMIDTRSESSGSGGDTPPPPATKARVMKNHTSQQMTYLIFVDDVYQISGSLAPNSEGTFQLIDFSDKTLQVKLNFTPAEGYIYSPNVESGSVSPGVVTFDHVTADDDMHIDIY